MLGIILGALFKKIIKTTQEADSCIEQKFYLRSFLSSAIPT